MKLNDYFRSSGKKPIISEQNKKKLKKQRDVDEEQIQNKKDQLLNKLIDQQQNEIIDEDEYAFKRNSKKASNRISKKPIASSEYSMSEEFDDNNFNQCSATEVISGSSQMEKKKKPNKKQNNKRKDIKIEYSGKKSQIKQSKDSNQKTSELIEYASKSENKQKKPGYKKVEVNTQLNGLLDQLTIVITGELEQSTRPDLTEILKRLGAKVTSAVSKKTSILVYGHKLEDGRTVDQSNKYKTAQKNGTRLMSENDLDAYLFSKTNFSLQQLIDKEDQQVIQQPSSPKPLQAQPQDQSNDSNSLWCDKYKPLKIEEIIGNQSQISKLKEWLQDWDQVVIKGYKKEIKTSFRAGGLMSGTINSRSTLISGPPGIGKTTSVRLLAQQLGYQLIEYNASDIRNKASIQSSLVHLSLNTMLNHQSFIIVMDEVDGMSSGDRGGMAAVIQVIKTTKVPIICICNDRSSQKVRSLAGHCYDLKYQKPMKAQVSKGLQQVMNRVPYDCQLTALEVLAEAMNNDIRQILQYLQMSYQRNPNTALSYNQVRMQVGERSKDQVVMMTGFESAGLFFNRDFQKEKTIRQKLDYYFIDYDIIPLIFQENYLSTYITRHQQSVLEEEEDLLRMSIASEQIVRSDLVSTRIRSQQQWSLLGEQGMYGVILPSSKIGNSFIPYTKFPEWLGKMSTTGKQKRIIKELTQQIGLYISGGRQAIREDYGPALLKLVMNSYAKDTKEGMDEVLTIMGNYDISIDYLKEHLLEIQYNPQKIDYFKKVSTANKSYLTRIYNNTHLTSLRGLKKKAKVLNNDEINQEQELNSDQDENDEEEKLMKELEQMQNKGKKGSKKQPVNKKSKKVHK